MNINLIGNTTTNLYTSLKSSLEKCEEFSFIVSFIRFSGLQLLLDTLKILEKKGVKGRILTTDYLGITEAKALEKILEFKNIELRFFNSENRGFHPKTFIFRNKENVKIITGSSNISFGGLKENIEWNNELVLEKSNPYISTVLYEFDSLWNLSQEYNKNYFLENSYFTSQNMANKIAITPNKMQQIALKNLDRIRLNKENKALCIAATGTGKTYLGAFDVKAFNPKRLLFISHREELLNSAKSSFSKVIKNKKMGIYSGNKKELDSEYLFSTIQTLHKNLAIFDMKEFDYIIVDEAHHISSNSYKKVLDHFKPKFLLGLTATPERSDGINIYEYFNDNIAIEIRIKEALEEQLIAPFHYFGISDIKEVDLSDIDLNKIDEIAKRLMIHKRTEFIIEKLNFYGYSGKKLTGLGFCANISHAEYMANEFNNLGIKSIFLTGKDSIEHRKKMIKELEDPFSNLKFIFTVDIFNEGVDIPNVNTILMLRPTNSPIVFIQQLGRGLRKTEDKEFVTILDFIGNHNKVFLLAQAFTNNSSYDKDYLKNFIKQDFQFSNSAHISMDEIVKERILSQIANENFNTLKYLKEEYFDFKNLIKRVPTYVDYINYEGAPNIHKYILKFKSYYNFLNTIKEIDLNLTVDDIKVLEELESYLPIKRVHEFAIINYLLEHENISLEQGKEEILKYLEKVNKTTVLHAFRNLDGEYLDSNEKKRRMKLFELKDNFLEITRVFKESLAKSDLKLYIKEMITYALLEYNKKFGSTDYGIPFLKLYESYSMRDVAILSNYEKLHSSYRNGINPSTDKKNYYLFINLEKDVNSTFDNILYDRWSFKWFSKRTTKLDSEIAKDFIYSRERGVKLHFFMRKFNKIDGITQPFVYLGTGVSIEHKNEKPIEFKIKLDTKIDNSIYLDFITK